MALLQTGPITLGDVPRIAAIVQQPLPPASLEVLKARGVSLLEFRLDAFPDGPAAALDYLRGLPPALRETFAFLGTVRVDYPADTELFPATPPAFESRAEIFQELFALVDAVDIEVESPERENLVSLAHRAECPVFLSSHDFTRTPAAKRLEGIVAEAERLHVTVLKLAVFAHNNDDLLRLLDFTRTCRFPRLITIAMGEYGLLSRVAAPFFGSLVSYGFLESANAPGQLSAHELHAELYRFHPGYRADFDARQSST